MEHLFVLVLFKYFHELNKSILTTLRDRYYYYVSFKNKGTEVLHNMVVCLYYSSII